MNKNLALKLQPLILTGLCLVSGMTEAEPVKITEKEAIGLFYQRNLELLAARYNIEKAQAQEIIAAAIPNPVIGIQLLEISENTNKNSSSQGCPQGQSCGPAEYYSFSQLIETAGKRGLRMKSASIAKEASENDFKDAMRILSNMVRDAYYDLLQAQKRQWLLHEIVDQYKKIIDSNRLRLQSGDIAELDFMRIEMEGLKAQSDLDNAHAALQLAQARFAMTLNWPDKSMQFAADENWPEIQDIGQNLSKEALINKAFSQRPDLQADKQRIDQAANDLTLARRLKYPDVTLTAGSARDPGNTVLQSYFAGVSLPAPLLYQYQGEEKQAAVNLEQMSLASKQTELGIRAEVVNALTAWKSADKVVQRFERELLGHAQKVHDQSEFAYRKGATSVMDLIDAQRNYKTVMFDYYAASINRVNAYYDLAKSLGIEADAPH